ncbi:hypothetical protein BDM02DRAFT_3190351 [Thelephora ganbajun]|uniref:Uncharacterized protein n=1 Tax=Thelephora ganbajun TaxID=370292 RepID=A0ACB6Z4Y9_THEGA|nr:hypothetical protein BDM02DRAFT_3190351 [Thelephora ganbajun]
MSYKIVANARRAEKEEAIRETAALTTRKLSNEEQRITASSAGIRAQDETKYVTEAYATKFLLLLSTAALSHNFLDCPIGSVPVTRMDPELDALLKDWSTTTSNNTPPSKELGKLLYGKRWWYDAGLVGERWEDEKVVEMMKVVDATLGEMGFLRAFFLTLSALMGQFKPTRPNTSSYCSGVTTPMSYEPAKCWTSLTVVDSGSFDLAGLPTGPLAMNSR